MRRREIVITLLVVAVILAVGLNSSVFVFRADVTKNKIYTFSSATRSLLQSIPQNVRISYWVSDRLRRISPVPGQIEDILREYAAVSHGRVSVRFVSPTQNGSGESPKALGLSAEQMNIVGQGAQTTASVYSGIAIQYLDRHTSIPFIATTKDIEYALTAKIEELLHPNRWRVGVLVGTASRSLSADYTLVADGLGQFYQVQPVKPGETIPSSTSVLIVLGAGSLSAGDMAPINSYLMGGGHVLFCVPGVSVAAKGNLKASLPGKLPIYDLLTHYGVTIDHELVLDAHNKHFRLLRQNGGQYVWQDFGPYPHWVHILPADVSATSPVTKNFSGLDLLWPSPLTVRNLPGIASTVLVKSSTQAWTMSSHFETNPSNIPAFSKPADPALTGQYDLAVSLTGRFTDYYSSRRSPATRMIVVGDDDFLSNLVHYSNSLSNMGFLQNSVDWLAGNENLLAIRTKAQWDPRLDKIADPQAKLRVYRFAQFVNVLLIPLLVVIVGLGHYRSRRRKRGPAREHA